MVVTNTMNSLKSTLAPPLASRSLSSLSTACLPLPLYRKPGSSFSRSTFISPLLRPCELLSVPEYQEKTSMIKSMAVSSYNMVLAVDPHPLRQLVWLRKPGTIFLSVELTEVDFTFNDFIICLFQLPRIKDNILP
ncbi:hypothetical protein HJG60_011382 [Phyllostomus discolor]|uniref:Uncharacterized protein n=1 Tax=Phyllostomus discolor TaxID=89673 RepID=A0A834E7T4_9CHIR|nr:hypothetical protein HJG60_011382 [Phyllostomus discolor]